MTIAIANPEDFIPDGDYNPHNVRPFVINNEYVYLCIAYASNLQDALDSAADADMLRGLALDREDADEREREYGGAGVMYLGNASEPFDSERAGALELPNQSPEFFRSMDTYDFSDYVRKNGAP